MNPQFVRDFGGPASFYKLLSTRQATNPLFLPRLLRCPRKRRRKQLTHLEVEVANLSSIKAPGTLLSCLVSASYSNGQIVSISFISFAEHSVGANTYDSNSSMVLHLPISPRMALNSPSDPRAERGDILLLVVAVKQSVEKTSNSKIAHPKGAGNIEGIVRKCVEKLLLEGSSGSVSAGGGLGSGMLQLSILEVISGFPLCLRKQTPSPTISMTTPAAATVSKIHSKQNHARSLNARSFCLPITLKSRRKVWLSSRPKDCQQRHELGLSALAKLASAPASAAAASITDEDIQVSMGIRWGTNSMTGDTTRKIDSGLERESAAALARDHDGLKIDDDDKSDTDCESYVAERRGGVPSLEGEQTSLNDPCHPESRLEPQPAASPLQCGVYYHYLYSEFEAAKSSGSSSSSCANEPQLVLKPVVEFRSRVECCWCSARHSSSSPKKCALTVDHSQATLTWTTATRTSIAFLLQHLKACHFHFRYESFSDQFGNLHIALQRNRSEDTSTESVLNEKWRHPFSYFNRERGRQTAAAGGARRMSLCDQLVLPVLHLPIGDDDDSNVGDNDSEEEGGQGDDTSSLAGSAFAVPLGKQSNRKRARHLNTAAVSGGGGDAMGTSLKVASAVRQYYHSRTGMPLVEEELAYDSDQETDGYGWQDLIGAHRLLDEFEDVSYEEKEFMKLWNTHIHVFPPYSDAYLPVIVERFVTRFGDAIARRKLRYNLLLHLMTMWDFGLLRGDEVQRLIAVVDARVAELNHEEAAAPAAAAAVRQERAMMRETRDEEKEEEVSPTETLVASVEGDRSERGRGRVRGGERRGGGRGSETEVGDEEILVEGVVIRGCDSLAIVDFRPPATNKTNKPSKIQSASNQSGNDGIEVALADSGSNSSSNRSGHASCHSNSSNHSSSHGSNNSSSGSSHGSNNSNSHSGSNISDSSTSNSGLLGGAKKRKHPADVEEQRIALESRAESAHTLETEDKKIVSKRK